MLAPSIATATFGARRPASPGEAERTLAAGAYVTAGARIARCAATWPSNAVGANGTAVLKSGQSGYSSLRHARGSADSSFGVRLSRNEWYGATNGSGAVTV
jgi:hypothetical protein